MSFRAKDDIETMVSEVISTHEWALPDETATTALAGALAAVLDTGLALYLHGPLGPARPALRVPC